MKKFSLALATAGLTASLGAYAAVPTDAQPYQVVVPNLKSGVEIFLEGLLVQPNSSNLNYARVVSVGANTTVPNTLSVTGTTTINQINPGYDFGFRVGLGWIFPNSGNDVQLNWTHFDHSDSNTTSAGPGQALITQAGVPFINLSTPTASFVPGVGIADLTSTNAPSATGNVSNKYNAIDLDAGQFLDVGTRFRTRMFAGLRVAQIESNLSDSNLATYNVSTVSAPTVNIGTDTLTENDTQNSKFNGIGPRVGFDTSYHIADCFGVVGHFSGSLLVGQVKSNNTFFASDVFAPVAGSVLPTTTDTFANNVNSNKDNGRVIPGFDSKLGLDYTYIFANQSTLSIEAGYSWTDYVNAVDRIAVPAGGITSTSITTSDFSLQGPYLQLNWKV